MGERAGKSGAQDVLGLVFCAVGGLFAVSIVLFLLGWESSGGAWTWPILERAPCCP